MGTADPRSGFPASAPDAWTKPPYFEILNQMMQANLAKGRLIYVSVAGRYTILLPGRQEDLGMLTDKDEVALATVLTGTGLEYRVAVRTDPGITAPD